MSVADRIVYGWAIVSMRGGARYFNDWNVHVPEKVMVKAAVDYMASGRRAEIMHNGKRAGTVVHAFPLTTDIAKAMGIASEQTGLMVGIRFDDPATIDRIERGELTGLSPGWTGYTVPAAGE